MQKDNNQSPGSAGFSKMKTILIVGVIVIVLVVIIFIAITSNIGNKAQEDLNANIKGSLAIVLANSMIYLDRNSNYNGFCENQYFTGPAATISAEGGSAICNEKSDNAAWCACTTLKVTSTDLEGSTFCVDNRGYKRVTQNTGGCDARCGSAGVCVD